VRKAGNPVKPAAGIVPILLCLFAWTAAGWMAGCDQGSQDPERCLVDGDCPYGHRCAAGECVPAVDEPDGADEPAGADDGGDPGSDDAGSPDGADPGPQYVSCAHTPDCEPDQVCSFLQLPEDVVTACRNPIPGGFPAPHECFDNNDCETGMCLCADVFCAGETGRCSAVCESPDDCPNGYMCSTASLPDLSGSNHFVFACIRDETVCLNHDDCNRYTCCRPVFGSDAITTQCTDSCEGDPDVGTACSGNDDCYAGWCFDYPAYCLDLCELDADCPVFDTQTACSSDPECDQGYLCVQNTCRREFTCRSMAFNLGSGVFDVLDICLPRRLPCELDSDCRTDEACKLYENEIATEVELQCEAGGPGAGGLGTDCTGAGSSACWSALCLSRDGGGAYCSHSCLTDEDCPPYADYRCGMLHVTVQEDHSSFVPVCKER
jgi:hypothetical protein